MHTLDTHPSAPSDPDRPRAGPIARPLAWLAAAAAVFFAVPLVGTDLLGLQPDLYYLGYFTAAVAFFVAFTLSHASSVREMWSTSLGRSIAVGAVAGAVLVTGILQQASTGHPDGWRFGFAIVWRGVVYGTVDAVTLYVLPATLAYLVLHGDRRGARRKVAFGALALTFSMVVTATYHLGYEEFRGATLRNPEIGAVVANVPTLLTGNPWGSVAAHSAMHVTAVVHQYDGGDQHMLPPEPSADYPDHGSSDVAAALAAGWLLVAAGAVTVLARRRRD